MSNVDRQRVAAVRKLEAMGYTFAASDWMQPANDAAAVVPAITDTLHGLLGASADALKSCTEGPDEEAELAYITHAIEAYEAVRWPGFFGSGEGREPEGSLAQLRMAVLELRPHRGRHRSNSGASSLPEVQWDCLRSG